MLPRISPSDYFEDRWSKGHTSVTPSLILASVDAEALACRQWLSADIELSSRMSAFTVANGRKQTWCGRRTMLGRIVEAIFDASAHLGAHWNVEMISQA